MIPSLSRRRFVTALAAAPALAAPAWAKAAATAPRVLSFNHLHTGERLRNVEYFSGGRYLPDALTEINQLLRDFRTGDVADMDPTLLDLLHGLQQRTGSAQAFQIISAYRSPRTNEMLHRRSSGVASGSLHLKGQAIDIRLGDVPLAQLRKAALSMKAGGVGYYPGSNFVHVDTGRVRQW
nr:DUF882 domain-containing protein [uncultured Caldimonas sp.]